jgi:hypothetical protein
VRFPRQSEAADVHVEIVATAVLRWDDDKLEQSNSWLYVLRADVARGVGRSSTMYTSLVGWYSRDEGRARGGGCDHK